MPHGRAPKRDAATDADRVAAVVEGWRRRHDTGAPGDPEELIREHADIAAPLRRALDAMRLLDRTFPRAAARVSSALDGQAIGPYRIESTLGAGGMGTVHLARVERAAGDLAPGTRVALKVVHPHLLDREGYVERFLREAELGRRVRHENVVRTLDAGVEAAGGGRRHYLVMEYVEGRTLRALLEESGRLPEELCRHVGRAVALALAAIHAAGVVHRDLKPDNVIVTPDHVVKVMDLGVARFVEDAARLSRTGAFVGSLRYGAPEQFGAPSIEATWGAGARSAAGAKGAGVDPRTDIHALGLLLYELATGTHPFEADDFAAVVHKVLAEVPRRAGAVNPQLSPLYEELVSQLLEKDPALRLQTAAEVAAILGDGEASAWWKARAQAIRRATRRPLRRIRIPRETALHGRATELTLLRSLYQRASEGDGQVAIVEGEAGIGKSRLVDEFVLALWANGEDLDFLFGSYPPGGAATAAGAFCTAYGAHLGDDESAVREALPQTPLLAASFAALLRGDAAPKGAERLTKDSLQTVFVHATRSFAARRTTIVLIDDLHFAPEEGRALFASLALAVPGHRILLVGCSRPGADERWTGSLAALPHVTRLPLARLGAKDLVGLLADALQSKQLAEELAGKVADKSDGNPLFVFEILRGLRDARLLARRADGSWTATREIRRIEVPPVIVEAVQSRVADLGAEDRNVLEVASCIGFEFDAALVGTVLGIAPIPLLQRLGAIEKRHRLVRAVGHLFAFDHHQVEEVLYTGLSMPLREAYHAAIADALESQHGAAAADPATLDGGLCAELAEHFLAGAAGARALRYVDAALAHFERNYLNDAAVHLADRVLAAPDLVTGEARIAMLLRKAARLDYLGDRGAQRDACRAARDVARETGDRGGEARALLADGQALLLLCRYEEAREQLAAAERLALEAGDRRAAAMAAAGVGKSLLSVDRYTEAEEHGRRCLGIARDIRDLSCEADATALLGLIREAVGDTAAGREQFERSLALARELHDAQGETNALIRLAGVHANRGQYDAARAVYARAIARAKEIGYRRGEAIATGSLGTVLSYVGLSGEAHEHASRCVDMSREVGDRITEAFASLSLGVSLVRLGRAAEARERLESVLVTAREVGDRKYEAYALLGLAELAEQSRDFAEAHRHTDAALAIQRAIGARDEEAATLAGLGALLLQEDRRAEARPHLDAALATARSLSIPDVQVSAAAYLAGLPGGDAADARAVLRANQSRVPLRTAMEALFVLWRATSDASLLAEANGLLRHLVACTPAEYRESMLASVPLHREIAAAAREAGLP
jgi:serine/threonine protein kinase/tetratricopeptide (TPR) repeat protein